MKLLKRIRIFLWLKLKETITGIGTGLFYFAILLGIIIVLVGVSYGVGYLVLLVFPELLINEFKTITELRINVGAFTVFLGALLILAGMLLTAFFGWIRDNWEEAGRMSES